MFTYILILLIGLAGGGICVYVLIAHREQAAREMQYQAELAVVRAEQAAARKEEASQHLVAKRKELESKATLLQRDVAAFTSRAVSYNDLQNENSVLKRDLRNLDIGCRKLELDRDVQRRLQHQLNERSQELANRYLNESVRWINAQLGANNYSISKQRLQEVVARCRAIGFDVPPSEEERLLADLKAGFEKAVRLAFEREEQSRIKARIREEQKLASDIKREMQRAELEKQAIQAALDRALREATDLHSAEIESLRARLAEAEARSERAISQAQLTKAGNVYVISNIGSFGESVFKVGMTRRLEPMDRVRELGDASVPFPFDVHMMISCDDAPKLENALHRELHKHRINHTNPRKEFFRTDIETIRFLVEKYHGTVEYVADPEALQYHQSLTMSEEDQEFIEHVFESMPEENEDADIDQEIE